MLSTRTLLNQLFTNTDNVRKNDRANFSTINYNLETAVTLSYATLLSYNDSDPIQYITICKNKNTPFIDSCIAKKSCEIHIQYKNGRVNPKDVKAIHDECEKESSLLKEVVLLSRYPYIVSYKNPYKKPLDKITLRNMQDIMTGLELAGKVNTKKIMNLNQALQEILQHNEYGIPISPAFINHYVNQINHI